MIEFFAEDIDMPDIRGLVNVHKGSMDWEKIAQYCDLFGMADLCEELKKGVR